MTASTYDPSSSANAMEEASSKLRVWLGFFFPVVSGDGVESHVKLLDCVRSNDSVLS